MQYDFTIHRIIEGNKVIIKKIYDRGFVFAPYIMMTVSPTLDFSIKRRITQVAEEGSLLNS